MKDEQGGAANADRILNKKSATTISTFFIASYSKKKNDFLFLPFSFFFPFSFFPFFLFPFSFFLFLFSFFLFSFSFFLFSFKLDSLFIQRSILGITQTNKQTMIIKRKREHLKTKWFGEQIT